ncbi:MAG: MFS transporter [Candidatus Bathyarchaeota archaeon]|nr:MFS transporter [Candidatus Bathyarchaeota archaeon]
MKTLNSARVLSLQLIEGIGMATESSYGFLRERNIVVLIFCRVIWGLTQGLFVPYFSLFALVQEGVTPELLGLAISAKAVGTAILAPIAGSMADSVGRKKMIFAGTALQALSYLLYFAARDFRMIFVGCLIEGLSIIHFPALMALTQDSVAKGKRGLGLSATFGLQTLPSLVSPLIGGILAERLGIDNGVRIGFALASGIGLGVAFIRLKFLRETLDDNRGKDESKNVILLVKESYGGMFKLLREYVELRGLIVLSMVNTFFGAITAPFWVVYAETVIGLSTVEWGLITVVATAVHVLFLLFSGRFADRYGSKTVMLANLSVAPLISLSFIYCQNLPQVLVFRILLTIQNAFTMPTANALVADTIPRERRGRAMAAIGWHPVIISLGVMATGFFRYPSYFIGSALSGYIFSLNAHYPWFLLAGAYVLQFVTCLFLVKQPEKPAD